MDSDIVLEMKGIHKRFQGVHALKGVDFSLRKGEVHALVGENGAGKSTLMKILVGLYHPDEGEIILRGERVSFKSVRDTRESGISMIFQEFNQVKFMTVMGNIFLGREPLDKFKRVDFAKMYSEAKSVFQKVGIDIDPRKRISELTVAKQQLVEIAKAISYNAQIIIMDEPTSALSDTEVEHLMEIVKGLRSEGRSIIFISHKLEEIYGICDNVTVLRDGNFIGSDKVKNVSTKRLIKMMVDREINELFPKLEADIGKIIFEARNLTKKGDFEDISFSLREGEILGLAGLMGAGRTEVVEAIVGERDLDRGDVILHGKKLNIKIPKDAIDNGIAMVPEDRKKNGLVLKLPVKDNILMSALKKCTKKGYIRKELEKEYVDAYAQLLEIKMSDENQVSGNLSGGNQQKVVVSRVLNSDPDIIILDEPTRGIDIKSKADIYRLASILVQRGKAIILISSEMPELLGMCDRIIVLHEGRISGELKREEADQNKIMQYALGHNITMED